jgi:hypothetical protein
MRRPAAESMRIPRQKSSISSSTGLNMSTLDAGHAQLTV